DWFVGQALGHPAADWSSAEPLVFKRLELFQIFKRTDVFQWVELELRLLFQPERTSRRLVKVPSHCLDGMAIERFADGIERSNRNFGGHDHAELSYAG